MNDTLGLSRRWERSANSGSLRAMALLGNLLICLIVLAAVAGGIALFWIARQDDSRAGRLLGLLAVALGAVALLYLGAGNHWF